MFEVGSTLQYYEPVLENGKKTVCISKETHDLGFSLWEDYLVGQFFGSTPRFAQIASTTNNLWGRRGHVEVLDLGNEVFLFRFVSKSTKTWVLNGRPWYISNRPILLQKWTPVFSKDKLSTSKFPIWIVLHGVPMELFTKEGLARIASAVGDPLHMDKTTELCRYVDIAKICEEVSREDFTCFYRC